MSARLHVQVEMARNAAAAGKRTLLFVATHERAVAVREEFGLVNHPLIAVLVVDPLPYCEEARGVCFVSFDDWRGISKEAWESMVPRGMEPQAMPDRDAN